MGAALPTIEKSLTPLVPDGGGRVDQGRTEHLALSDGGRKGRRDGGGGGARKGATQGRKGAEGLFTDYRNVRCEGDPVGNDSGVGGLVIRATLDSERGHGKLRVRERGLVARIHVPANERVGALAPTAGRGQLVIADLVLDFALAREVRVGDLIHRPRRRLLGISGRGGDARERELLHGAVGVLPVDRLRSSSMHRQERAQREQRSRSDAHVCNRARAYAESLGTGYVPVMELRIGGCSSTTPFGLCVPRPGRRLK